MPLPTPNEDEKQDGFISRCMGNDTVKKDFPDQKQRSAVCFSQWRKGKDTGENVGGESMRKENVKLKFKAPFNVVTEGLQEDNEQRKIKGTMIVATTSRNGVTYLAEELSNARFSSDTISVNHTEDVTDNVGKFIPSKSQDRIDFEGVVFNTAKHPGIVHMLDKGLIKFTSIEAIVDEIERDPQTENIVAKGIEITGLGLVKTPGIPEASVAIAEAFNTEEPEGSVETTENITGGKDMTKKVIEQEETPTEEETTKEEEKPSEEKPAEEPIEKPAESTESLLIKKLDEEVTVLKESVKKLSEKKETKGVFTENKEESTPLKFETNKDGTKNFYAESVEY